MSRTRSTRSAISRSLRPCTRSPWGTIRGQLRQPPAAAGAPAGGNAPPLTPRALAEPALNRLAGTLLGPADRIRLRPVPAESGAHAGDGELAAPRPHPP